MTSQKELFITIGIPASGKSTWIESQRNLTVISPDEIRKELYDDYQQGITSPEVWSTAYERLDACLELKDKCVFDATNTLPEHRATIISRGKKSDAKVTAMFFPINVRLAIHRNATRIPREKRVPKHVIYRYHDVLVPPSRDEGFDEIVVKRQVPIPKDCKDMGGKIKKNECEICEYLDIK